MSSKDVTIIGGGLAGLACGVRLAERGIDFQILEATDRVGGRVRTDVVDGFQLDHGFQVLLTAYPAARELLDYDQLDLRSFDPGAMIRKGDSFSAIDDPWRRPRTLLSNAFSNVGTLADKLRIAKLRHDVCQGEIDDLFLRVEQPTRNRLRALNFSEDFISDFLRPWFAGIFLDRDLDTSSRMMEFVFRMFAQGDAVVPAAGMQAIPEQLASKLPAGSVQTSATVTNLDGSAIEMSDGSRTESREIVIATEGTAAARLLGQDDAMKWQQVSCLYFAADRAPLNSKKLVLSGNGGPINNLCEISSVAPSYAPEGKALVSVSVVGKSEDTLTIVQPVRDQLRQWFGSVTDKWEMLRSYHIPYALPSQTTERTNPVLKPVDIAGKPIVCGDHRETSSIQGALNSGMRAAEAVMGRLER